ncbi:hypothetical protein [Agathobacter sp.]
MERLTSNKNVSDMSMIELAHNSCYADNERNARYRDYEMDMDARDFARNLMVTLTKDELPISDTEFDMEILDDLAIDPFSDVRGLIALFYRNLWAMANLRETLKKYEDLEERGRLIKLPCKVGDTVWDNDYGRPCAYTITAFSFGECEEYIYEPVTTKEVVFYYTNSSGSITGSFAESEIGKSVFLSKSEAEAKLKELRGGENGSME